MAVDQCIWYQENTINFYYVEDGIFMGLDSKAIDKMIEEIEKAGLYIEDIVKIDAYLGVNIEEQYKGNIRLTQSQIIDIILSNVNLPKNMAPIQTPTLSTKIL